MQMNVDGQRVKTLRLQQSWSQELLAEKAGVSLRTIQRIEAGGVASLQTLRAVAAALDVPAASLAVSPPEASPAQADAAHDGGERTDEGGEPADDAQDGSERAAPDAAPPLAAPPPPAARRATVPLKDLLRTALPAVAVTLLLGAGIVYLATDNDLAREGGAENVEQAPRVVTVRYGDIEHAVGAQAKLEPRRFVRVEGVLGARVDRILVAVGDEVVEDQPVAYLDARALQNRVESAEAGAAIQRSQLAPRRSALQVASSRLEEAQRRYASEGGDELELELAEARHGIVAAEAALFEAEQRIRSSELDLEAARAELERYFIKAPISGTVTSIAAAPGAMLDRYAVVLEIADLTTMTAVAAIGEADIGALHTGGEAYVTTLSGGPRRWLGRLRDVMPSAESRGGTLSYRGYVDLDNSDGSLIAGMTAQVFFPLESAENVLVVPVSALKMMAGVGEPRRATVRVVSDAGTEAREIVIGAMDRINAEVLSGLREGERVIAGDPSS